MPLTDSNILIPFDKTLGTNLDSLNKRIDLNKAAMILLDGQLGEGKTTLAVEVADYINNINGLKEITLDIDNHPQLAMGGKDFQKKLEECYNLNLPVIIYDEAGDFSKRGFLTKFNQSLNRTFETFRAFKIIVILCLPCVDDLDESLFKKGIPRLLLNLKGRTKNQGNFSAYSLSSMLWLRHNMKKTAIKQFCYAQTQPNFRGHFKNLEKSRSDKLDRLSTKEKIKLLQAYNIEGLLSYNDIATRFNRTRHWVMMICKKKRIKFVKRVRQTLYFDQSCLDIIDQEYRRNM